MLYARRAGRAFEENREFARALAAEKGTQGDLGTACGEFTSTERALDVHVDRFRLELPTTPFEDSREHEPGAGRRLAPEGLMFGLRPPARQAVSNLKRCSLTALRLSNHQVAEIHQSRHHLATIGHAMGRPRITAEGSMDIARSNVNVATPLKCGVAPPTPYFLFEVIRIGR